MTDRPPHEPAPGVPRSLVPRPSGPEVRRVADALRTETTGGVLLLLGALLALLWANSPWSAAYVALGRVVPYPDGGPLHLDLSLAEWAADGLLAVFFFVVGLELTREFVAGDLRDPRRAMLPVIAAVGGMALPAAIFVLVNLGDRGALAGWAIPTATDIAFATAVLAVVNSHLPHGLRAFLLTLAVVDDLLAITIIAVFYTDDFSAGPLLAAALPLLAFAALVRRGRTWWWALLPLAGAVWLLTHASGVHATVAGVLLAFTVPVGGAATGLADRLEHRWRPVSAGFAVPLFAFFAAGVSLRGGDFARLVTDPVVVGVVLGLVLGKTLGVFGATWLTARLTRATLDPGLSWSDLLGVALLSGIGFTVSLLIGELAYGVDNPRYQLVKAAVLTGSVIAALLAAALLARRNVVHRRIHQTRRTG
ncbi:MAG TPA: Na+/H+ antiporter NhaA [Micromonospora sp.]